MTPLELKILIYGLLAFGFASGNIWLGYHFTALHYGARMAAQELAQDQVTQAQQAKSIAALEVQQAATAAAENKYVDLKNTADATARQLADSVHAFTALRRNLLPTASTTPSGSNATSQGAGGDSEVTGLVRQAAEACLGDAAALTGLQTWASTSTTSH